MKYLLIVMFIALIPTFGKQFQKTKPKMDHTDSVIYNSEKNIIKSEQIIRSVDSSTKGQLTTLITKISNLNKEVKKLRNTSVVRVQNKQPNDQKTDTIYIVTRIYKNFWGRESSNTIISNNLDSLDISKN